MSCYMWHATSIKSFLGFLRSDICPYHSPGIAFLLLFRGSPLLPFTMLSLPPFLSSLLSLTSGQLSSGSSFSNPPILLLSHLYSSSDNLAVQLGECGLLLLCLCGALTPLPWCHQLASGGWIGYANSFWCLSGTAGLGFNLWFDFWMSKFVHQRKKGLHACKFTTSRCPPK